MISSTLGACPLVFSAIVMVAISPKIQYDNGQSSINLIGVGIFVGVPMVITVNRPTLILLSCVDTVIPHQLIASFVMLNSAIGARKLKLALANLKRFKGEDNGQNYRLCL